MLDYEQEFEQYHARNLALAQEYDVPLDKDKDDVWFRQWVRTHG